MKKVIITISILIIFVTAIILYINLKPNSAETKENKLENLFENKNVSFTSQDIIKNINNSQLWNKKAILTTDEDKFIIKYENKEYPIIIQDSSYYFKISNTENNKNVILDCFGAIIDITQNLQNINLGTYNETYQKNVNLEIKTNGINVYQDTQYLEIYYEFTEPQPTYVLKHSYQFSEIIPISELTEIAIENAQYKITSLSSGYSIDINTFSICGNIFNQTNQPHEFLLTIYNNDQTKIQTEKITILESTQTDFCTNTILESLTNQEISYFKFELTY